MEKSGRNNGHSCLMTIYITKWNFFLILVILVASFALPVSASVINIPSVKDVPSVLGLNVNDENYANGGSYFLDGVADENLSRIILDSLYSFSYNKEIGMWDAYNPEEDIAISTGDSGKFGFKTGRGSFQMSLTGLGRGFDLKAPGKGTIETEGRSLDIVYDGFTEWYKNNDEGIEHGMTVFKAPPGDGNLVAGFMLSGNLSFSSTAGSIYFSDDDGYVFEYGGIKAWDFSGKILDSSMTLSNGSIFWEINDKNAAYPVYIDPILTQIKILSASDKTADDNFGRSVAVSGDIAVVGADYAESGGLRRGQAYVFSKNSGGSDNWGEIKILSASNKTNYDNFGCSVAVSEDIAVVGAESADFGGLYRGQAYVFSRNSGGADNWGEIKNISASDNADSNYFGHSVAVSGDIIVVGAYKAASGGTDRGQAYVFSKNSGGADNWGEVKILSASDKTDNDWFGYSVAIDNDTALVGAYQADSGGTDRGQAYVFSKNSGGADNWGEVKILSASDKEDNDQFGYSVAIDNDTAFVGARGADSGGTDRGQAYVFSKNSGGADNWGEVKILSASDKEDNDRFGNSVSVDNETALVGAREADSGGTNRGQAYVFSKNSGGADNWGEDQIISAPDKGDNDQFGYSLSFSGDTAIFGAPFADSGGDNNCGKGYIFINASAPTFTGIVPSSAFTDNTSVNVTITGTSYYAAPVVKLKKAGQTDITATGVTVTSGNTTINCFFNLTGAVTGAWDVEITNPDTKSVTGTGVFTVEPIPVFTSINPSSGANYDGECPVKIMGSSFAAGVSVKIKNNAGTEIEADNEVLTGTTQIDCTLNLSLAVAGADWDVIITNTDGGTGTAVDAFTVTGHSAPSGGGTTGQSGGGSNTDTGVGASQNLKAGDTASFNFEGKGAVDELSVEVNEDTKNLMVTVTKESSLPSSIDSPDTVVYQYEEVKTYHIDPSAISCAKFEFSVEKSWLTKYGYTMGDVVMLHYKDGEWVTLPTKFVREEGGYYYYTAETPSFSWFAIGIGEGETILPEETPEVIAAETSAPVAEVTTPVETASPKPLVTEKGDSGQDDEALPAILLIIVIFVVLVVAAFIWKRKQKEKYPEWWDKKL